MATFTPQYSLYQIIEKINQVCGFIFWVIFSFSLTPTILELLNVNWPIENLLNVFNIIAILLYFVLDIIADQILIPEAEKRRRDDFLDNSFDSKFVPENSIDYYDNEEVNFGFTKASANLFQNTYFTYSLIKLLTIRKIIIPAIILIVVLIAAYFGFKEVPFFLSLLQVLFSANVLANLIKHLILLNKLSVIFDDWLKLYQPTENTNRLVNTHVEILRNWLRYETLVTKIPVNIFNSFFQKHNPQLTKNWITLKVKYNIK